MNRSRLPVSARARLGIWSAGGLMVLAVAWPPLDGYLDRQSRQMVGDSVGLQTADPRQAALRLKIASYLTPRDWTVRYRLADIYQQTGQPDQALAVLQRVPTAAGRLRRAELLFEIGKYLDSLEELEALPSESTAALIIQNRLELGQADEAIRVGEGALDSPQARLRLGLAYAFLNRHEALQALIREERVQETARRLRRSLNELGLAQELYGLGMGRSAQQVLLRPGSESTERYLLLARTYLTIRPVKAAGLKLAQEQLEKGIRLKPAELELHLLLREVYLQLEDQAGADKEEGLIRQLERKE